TTPSGTSDFDFPSNIRLAFTAITLSAARIGIVPMTKARIARKRRDHRSQVRRFIAAHIKGPREQSKTASGKWRSPNGERGLNQRTTKGGLRYGLRAFAVLSASPWRAKARFGLSASACSKAAMAR